MFLELGDHLGSTSVVLDHGTGELVERSTAFAYGASESDYRPGRWEAFREDYRFTGKEDDVEVGLIYFGARYYAPLLQRWVSADPLAVHAPGQADLNVYAYVSGHALRATDPTGHLEIDWNSFRPGNLAKLAQGAAEGIGDSAIGLARAASHPVETVGRITDAISASYRQGGIIGAVKSLTVNPVVDSYKAMKAAESRGDYQEAGKEAWNTAFAASGVLYAGSFATKSVVNASSRALAVVRSNGIRIPVLGVGAGGVGSMSGTVGGTGIVPSAKTYITYVFKNQDGQVVYVGRASGAGSAEEVLKQRLAKGHHVFDNNNGLQAVVRDVQSTKEACMGAEQSWYNYYREQGASLLNDPGTPPLSSRPDKSVRTQERVNAYIQQDLAKDAQH